MTQAEERPPAPVRLIGHRGASSDAHENTLAAIREALRQGADGVELDVRVTAPGLDEEEFRALVPPLEGEVYDASEVEDVIEDLVFRAGQDRLNDRGVHAKAANHQMMFKNPLRKQGGNGNHLGSGLPFCKLGDLQSARRVAKEFAQTGHKDLAEQNQCRRQRRFNVGSARDLTAP